ncbi:MAG: T9SS type A sorting domain-containing protein [Candidatus Kryptonium sp.]|nr:T9SS type A sorting domain-containing protein [Candidatus Kryptonium sp.]
MKKLALIIAFLVSTVALSQSPFRLVPIQEIQWVHPDSLRKADSLQAAGVAFNSVAFPHWIEDSRYWYVPPISATQYGDTFTVVGIVMNRPQMYTLGNRYVVFIQDTAGGPWSGIIVLANDTTSANTQATGIQVLDTGMVVKIVGRVEEFPASSSTGYTELFTVIPDPRTGQIIPIEVIDWKLSRPEPVEVRVSDFVRGNASVGGHRINFSNGERWEDVYVIIRNVSVVNRSGTVGGRWTWWIGDDSGNVIQVYDGSRHFRGGSGAFNPNWTPPPIGTKLEYIRGVIVGVGSGYAITPLYPDDVKILSYAPEINYAFTTPQKREPALPSSTDPVKIRAIVKVTDPTPGVVIDTVRLLYSVNYGSFREVLMSKISGDTLWEGIIPPQPNGSLVRYFFRARDSKGQTTQLPGDTSQNIYFYFVKDGELKIRDLQYTILRNGNTGFWDLRVKVRGIVVADTNDFPTEPPLLNPGSKEQYRVYIQDDTSAWSGIRLFGSRSYVLRRGDSVEVIGTVRERNNVTEIVVDSVRIIARNRPVYPAVVVRTGDVGNKPNGTESAEKWENMLIRFVNVLITDVDPDRNGGTFREFVVDDGTGGCRVNDDGGYKFSNYPPDTAYGYRILYVGNRISYLQGILHFSFNNYKIEPRSDEDFGTITKVVVAYNSEIPEKFELLQNYPNPFNPSTYIEYKLPKRVHVTLKVYDVLGREVATLVDEVQNAGSYRVRFENPKISSGVYFYVLKAENFVDVKKMMLLK